MYFLKVKRGWLCFSMFCVSLFLRRRGFMFRGFVFRSFVFAALGFAILRPSRFYVSRFCVRGFVIRGFVFAVFSVDRSVSSCSTHAWPSCTSYACRLSAYCVLMYKTMYTTVGLCEK